MRTAQRLSRLVSQSRSGVRAKSDDLAAGFHRTSRSGEYSFGTVALVGTAGVFGGVMIGDEDSRLRKRTLPSGQMRACCDAVMTDKQKGLSSVLEGIVGKSNVKDNVSMRGSRLGEGTAHVMVKPGTLAEAVKVLEACVAADVAILPQGANTSLTGGSVPRNAGCDRPTVVLNLRRLDKIFPVGEDAKQVLCFAGAGIFDLQDKLAKEFNRDSHSVLGSIFLNPSVAAGVSYGSGGTQIRKGPSFTERALFCRVNKNGEVELVNTLGIKDKGNVLDTLDDLTSLSETDMDPKCRLPASFPKYAEKVTKLTGECARFNADTYGADCNRSEGKVLILATMHDTYPMPKKSKLIWVSCKEYSTAHKLKKEVCLATPKSPAMTKTCEYLNRDTFDAVDRAGRVLIYMIDILGMRRLEPLWNLKLFIEGLPIPFSKIICDKFLYWANPIIPNPITKTLYDMGKEYDHHMLMELAEYSDGEIATLEERLEKFAASMPPGEVKYHACEDTKEKTRATLFRFAVAPAFRTYCIGLGMQGLSIDYALPKNYTVYPKLPEEQYPLRDRLVYSHFGCNVYHEDFVFKGDVDVEKAKYAIKHAIEDLGGKLPAEHGHGTEYKAPPETQKRWQKMDPLNIMNPGVGGSSWNKSYADKPQHLHTLDTPQLLATH